MDMKKYLKDSGTFARIMGFIHVAIGIIFVCLGIVDLVNGEKFVVICTYMGVATGAFSISAILLVLSGIAAYYQGQFDE